MYKRQLSQAAGGPRDPDRVDVAALITHAVADRQEGTAAANLEIPNGELPVTGDAKQLALAVDAIVKFADELAELATACRLVLQAHEDSVRIRLIAHGQGLANWQLPHTFEPFYPQRLIRGQSHGLGLFLAQTIVHAHRGQATVRRLADGALQLEFVLPA